MTDPRRYATRIRTLLAGHSAGPSRVKLKTDLRGSARNHYTQTRVLETARWTARMTEVSQRAAGIRELQRVSTPGCKIVKCGPVARQRTDRHRDRLEPRG